MSRIEMSQVSFWDNIETDSKWVNFFETVVSWSGKEYKIKRVKDEGLYERSFQSPGEKWKSVIKNIARIFLFTITLFTPLIVKAINRSCLKRGDNKIFDKIKKDAKKKEDELNDVKKIPKKIQEEKKVKEPALPLNKSVDGENKISPHSEDSSSSDEEKDMETLDQDISLEQKTPTLVQAVV